MHFWKSPGRLYTMFGTSYKPPAKKCRHLGKRTNYSQHSDSIKTQRLHTLLIQITVHPWGPMPEVSKCPKERERDAQCAAWGQVIRDEQRAVHVGTFYKNGCSEQKDYWKCWNIQKNLRCFVFFFILFSNEIIFRSESKSESDKCHLLILLIQVAEQIFRFCDTFRGCEQWRTHHTNTFPLTVSSRLNAVVSNYIIGDCGDLMLANIHDHIAPYMWPSNRPDLNHLHFCLWGVNAIRLIPWNPPLSE